MPSDRLPVLISRATFHVRQIDLRDLLASRRRRHTPAGRRAASAPPAAPPAHRWSAPPASSSDRSPRACLRRPASPAASAHPSVGAPPYPIAGSAIHCATLLVAVSITAICGFGLVRRKHPAVVPRDRDALRVLRDRNDRQRLSRSPDPAPTPSPARRSPYIRACRHARSPACATPPAPSASSHDLQRLRIDDGDGVVQLRRHIQQPVSRPTVTKCGRTPLPKSTLPTTLCAARSITTSCGRRCPACPRRSCHRSAHRRAAHRVTPRPHGRSRPPPGPTRLSRRLRDRRSRGSHALFYDQQHACVNPFRRRYRRHRQRQPHQRQRYAIGHALPRSPPTIHNA